MEKGLKHNIALLIIDMQNDFLEGGSLEVPDGCSIIPLINKIHTDESIPWHLTVLSADWHPANHFSFQVNNPGSSLFKPWFNQKFKDEQVMWPIHCVENTKGADFHQDLVVLDEDHIIKKGTIEGVESYSAFGKLPEDTGLADLLKKNEIKKVFVVGLAFDYCVGSTAIDAAQLGYQVYLIKDATKHVDSETACVMTQELEKYGVDIIESSEIAEAIEKPLFFS